MDALHELRALSLVTLAARDGNVDLGNRRSRIGSWKDVVAFVAVSAHSGRNVPLRERFRMHALPIRKERAIADAASLHHRFVPMTTPAGLGDVAAIGG